MGGVEQKLERLEQLLLRGFKPLQLADPLLEGEAPFASTATSTHTPPTGALVSPTRVGGGSPQLQSLERSSGLCNK